MKLNLSILSAALAASVISTPAFSEPEFSTWDKDGNGSIALTEWDTAIESGEVFDKLDENKNGIFDIGESDEGLFDYDVAMDLDDGGHIERQEFTVGTFNHLDSNDDEMLTQQEFSKFGEKASESQLFSRN